MAMRILGLAMVFSQLLLLLGRPVSSSPVPTVGHFVEVSCKSCFNPTLCSATLVPHAKDIKNKPVEAVKLMMAVTKGKADEMVKFLKDLQIRVNNSAATERSQDLDYAVGECLRSYEFAAESMQNISSKLEDIHTYRKGSSELWAYLDDLDVRLMDPVDSTTRCNSLMDKVPAATNHFRAEFDARRDHTEAKAFISVVYHLFGELQSLKQTGHYTDGTLKAAYTINTAAPTIKA